jgi:hypothetical protein
MSDGGVLDRWIESDRDIENLMPLAALCWFLDQDRMPDFYESCKALNGVRKLEDSTLGARLCQDIAEVIQPLPSEQSHISNADLVALLRQIDDSPWADVDKFNANRMARHLRPYAIRSTKFNQQGTTVRGYHLSSLRTALTPYLTVHPSDSIENKQLNTETSVQSADGRNGHKPHVFNVVRRLTHISGDREPGEEAGISTAE